jgi:hypothetical protein
MSWRIPEIFTASSCHVFGGEECFIIMPFHMIKGTPFTDMSQHTFGGDPRQLSTMKELVIDHIYLPFYNKISGASLDQWIPTHIDRCRQLIQSALADGVIKEAEFENGEVVDRQWILHHFQFSSF